MLKLPNVSTNNGDLIVSQPLINNPIKYSVICCISLNGDYLPPLAITCRKQIGSEIANFYGKDNFRICYQPNGFCDSDTFLKWTKTCFLERLEQLRSKHQYYGKCLLILDGYFSHMCKPVVDLLNSKNVILMLLPAHTSYLL